MGHWKLDNTFVCFVLSPRRFGFRLPPGRTSRLSRTTHQVTMLASPSGGRWQLRGCRPIRGGTSTEWSFTSCGICGFDNFHSTARHVAKRTKECLEPFKRARSLIPVWVLVLFCFRACVLRLGLLSKLHGRGAWPFSSFVLILLSYISLKWKAELVSSSFKNNNLRVGSKRIPL